MVSERAAPEERVQAGRDATRSGDGGGAGGVDRQRRDPEGRERPPEVEKEIGAEREEDRQRDRRAEGDVPAGQEATCAPLRRRENPGQIGRDEEQDAVVLDGGGEADGEPGKGGAPGARRLDVASEQPDAEQEPRGQEGLRLERVAVADVEVVPRQQDRREGGEPCAADAAPDRIQERDGRRSGQGREQAALENQGRQGAREHRRVGRRLPPERAAREHELVPSPDEIEEEIRVDEPAGIPIACREAGREYDHLALVRATAREGKSLAETPQAERRTAQQGRDEQARRDPAARGFQAGRGRSPICRAGTPATIE